MNKLYTRPELTSELWHSRQSVAYKIKNTCLNVKHPDWIETRYLHPDIIAVSNEWVLESGENHVLVPISDYTTHAEFEWISLFKKKHG